jgi:hypothetical protein
MAIFRSTAKPSTQNLAYLIPADLQDVMTALEEALDGRTRVDAAVAKNAAARQAASETRIAAEAEATRIETELALEIDDAKIIALEGRVESARQSALAATAVFDRADRVQGNLYALAPDSDAQIAAATQKFQAAVAAYGCRVNEALAVETQEAVQHLVAVLKRGHAIADRLRTIDRNSGFLATEIPSPDHTQQAIVGNGRAALADGTRIDLAATWSDDPAAAALADIIKPLADLRQRAAGHRAFSPPPPPAAPYVAQNHRTAEEIAAERAADAAWKPPASTWVGHVHRFDGSRPGNARGVELNVVAGIADEALKPSDAA